MTDVERPRPDLPFGGPGRAADRQQASALGRRLGPIVAVVALAVSGALVLWAALAPTAIAGNLAEAPFVVPGTLVLGPDGDGCLTFHAGDGGRRDLCVDGLAAALKEGEGTEVWYAEGGSVVIGVYHRGATDWFEVDPATGAVDVSRTGEPPSPRVTTSEPPEVSVGTSGDRVVRFDGPGDEQVLLDLGGPPGYQLRTAAIAPDGAWVVAVTPRGEVVVAPGDGSAQPYRWATDVGEDRWVDVHGRVAWTDG